MDLTVRVRLDEMDLARGHPALALLVQPAVRDGVFKVIEDPNVVSHVRRVDQDRTALEEVSVPFLDDVDGGVKKGVPGAHETGQWLPRHRDELLLEGNALIAVEDGISASDLAISAPDGRGNLRDLEPLLLTLVAAAAEQLESL